MCFCELPISTYKSILLSLFTSTYFIVHETVLGWDFISVLLKITPYLLFKIHKTRTVSHTPIYKSLKEIIDKCLKQVDIF